MNISCDDRERIFLDGTREEWTALEAHAAGCPACQREVETWRNLSLAAADLHQEWDSPALWPRIERALAEQAARRKTSWLRELWAGWNLGGLEWRTAAAALLLVALTGLALWKIRNPVDITGALLGDQAVNEVQRAEAAYEQAIDKLDARARPQLENASTPLMASYREKLLVLDSAIADLKSQTGINPGNGHLRRQLLAMYREKQDTLEQVLEAKQ